jgi:hypothetical protein
VIALQLALGAAIGFVISWQTAQSRIRAGIRRGLAQIRADTHQEVMHWQEAAARANAEAARLAREAKAHPAGREHGREEAVPGVAQPVVTQRGSAGAAVAGGDQR